MAWTAPMTAAFNATFTAAEYNTHVRDNFLETAPAKATTTGGYFVGTAANAIVQRVSGSQFVSTSEGTASITPVNLTTVGPTVTLTTGTKALVTIAGSIAKDTADSAGYICLDVSGATTIAASVTSQYTVQADGISTAGKTQLAECTWVVPLNAGSNTFTMKYAVSSGNGTFRRRSLAVMPF